MLNFLDVLTSYFQTDVGRFWCAMYMILACIICIIIIFDNRRY